MLTDDTTTTPLSEIRVEEIRARLNAATPGPWQWEDWDNAPPSLASEALTTLVAPPSSRPNGPSSSYPDLGAPVIKGDFLECTEADKALIAHAPEDVRALLADRDRLLRRVEEGVQLAKLVESRDRHGYFCNKGDAGDPEDGPCNCGFAKMEQLAAALTSEAPQ